MSAGLQCTSNGFNPCGRITQHRHPIGIGGRGGGGGGSGGGGGGGASDGYRCSV